MIEKKPVLNQTRTKSPSQLKSVEIGDFQVTFSFVDLGLLRWGQFEPKKHRGQAILDLVRNQSMKKNQDGDLQSFTRKKKGKNENKEEKEEQIKKFWRGGSGIEIRYKNNKLFLKTTSDMLNIDIIVCLKGD